MAYTNDAPEEKTTEDVVSSVLIDFNKAWKAKQPKEELFREIYRRYRSYLEVTRQTTRSTLFIPEAFTLIETVAPRMTARKPTFKVLPRESTDITQADAVGQLLEYQYDMMDLHSKIKRYSKQSLIYGTSIMKMGWDPEKEMPAAFPIDLADIWPDPNTYYWDEGYIIHRFYKTYEELEASSIKYKNLDLLKSRQSGVRRDDQMVQDRRAIQEIPYDNQSEGCEVLERWKFIGGEVYVSTVVDRSVEIRHEKSPFALNELPFVPVFDQEVIFEKWGIGEIEPVMDLIDEENTTRNQRVDEKNLSIHNMWVVSKTAGVDYRSLISKPGGIILAQDINGIKPLDKQNITQNSIEEIRLIKDDIRNTTGVNDYVRGADTGASTATETAIKTQEANVRFAEKVNNLEIALKKIGRWMVALNAQYLTKAQKLRIMGKYGLEEKKVAIKDIRGQYDVDIETGSSLPANPDLRRNQLRELLATIAPFLTNPNGIPDGMRELLRTIIQSYDLKNADEILQGAQHPEIMRAMAQLDGTELDGTNPQMVEAELKRMMMREGMLGAQEAPQQAGSVQASAPQLPAAPTM